MATSSPLAGLRAKGVEELLEELGYQSVRAHADGEERQLLTLWLRSGSSVTGRLVDITRARHGGLCLLLDRPAPDDQAIYLEAETVDAVTVHDVVARTRAPASLGPAPTPLELKRRLAAVEAERATQVARSLSWHLDWEKLPDEPATRHALADLIERTGRLVGQIAEKTDGASALKEKVDTIELRLGSQCSVALTERRLAVQSSSSWPDRYRDPQLLKDLESAL